MGNAQGTYHLITVLRLGVAVLLHAQLGVLGLALALVGKGSLGSGGVVDGSVVTHGGRFVIVVGSDGGEREGEWKGEDLKETVCKV